MTEKQPWQLSEGMILLVAALLITMIMACWLSTCSGSWCCRRGRCLNNRYFHYCAWSVAAEWALTNGFKCRAVKDLPINGVLINLPIARVHDGPVLAAQNEAAAVWNRVRHSQRRAPIPTWLVSHHTLYERLVLSSWQFADAAQRYKCMHDGWYTVLHFR